MTNKSDGKIKIKPIVNPKSYKEAFGLFWLFLGYGFTDILQNKEFSRYTYDKFDEPYKSVFHDQTSDFFGGAFYTMTVGSVLDYGLRSVVNKVAPDSKAAKLIDNNYNTSRSVLTYTALGIYEGMQSVGGRFDWKDMGAYAAGITAFVLLPTAAKSIRNGIKNLFKSNNDDVSSRNNTVQQNLSLKYSQCNF